MLKEWSNINVQKKRKKKKILFILEMGLGVAFLGLKKKNESRHSPRMSDTRTCVDEMRKLVGIPDEKHRGV